MDYRKDIESAIIKSKDEIKKAKFVHEKCKYGLEVYDAIYKLTDNQKFSYQIASSFDFDRILKSKEFTQEEKDELSNNIISRAIKNKLYEPK